MPTIKIENILGGHAPSTHFAAPGQFKASLGIDPSQPIDDADSATTTIASGLLRPAASQKFSGTTIVDAPMFLIPNPKDALIYVYDAGGSVYTVSTAYAVTTLTGLDTADSKGNGCAYYDNYIYFARNDTVARYGPLSGVAALTTNYWAGTLAKAALINTTYPTDFKISRAYPNHILHRHSDGKLYIADVVGNQGTLHYIRTKKVAVEGDTDNTSTASALTVGFGLWPTALESYGTDLVMAFYEGSTASWKQGNAKIGFWDTTATSINRITWVEFPDQFVTKLKNVNGVLYAVSGNFSNNGFRISQLVGNYAFKTIYYSAVGEPPFPGAVDQNGTLGVGNFTTIPESAPCVFNWGLSTLTAHGLFNTFSSTGGTTATVTSLVYGDNVEFGFNIPIIGWSTGATGGSNNGLDRQLTTYNNAPQTWWSPLFKVGRRFEVKKIRLHLTGTVGLNTIITPKIYTDDGTGTTTTLTTINNANFGGMQNIVLRPASTTGLHNFWLELRWTGSAVATVGLPIEVDFDTTIDD